jgi:hypothetical protein
MFTPNIGVTTDDVLAGANSDTGANGVADLSQIWRIRAQAGSNGAANGSSSLAPIGTQGAVFDACDDSEWGESATGIHHEWHHLEQRWAYTLRVRQRARGYDQQWLRHQYGYGAVCQR